MNASISMRLLASMRVWIDYQLCKNAGAYSSQTINLYDYEDPKYPNYEVLQGTAYQWVYDSSIMTVPTEIDHSGGTVARGSGGLRIDFDNGRIISDSGENTGLTTPSIDVGVKEVNTYITTASYQDLISQMNTEKRPDFKAATGALKPDDIITPCLFIKLFDKNNTSFCLGGQDRRNFSIRCIVFANDWQIMGVQDALTDTHSQCFPLLDADDLPLDEFGDLKSPPFNYETLLADANYDNVNKKVFINKVVFNSYENDRFSDNNPSLRLAIIDFHLSDI